MLRWMIGSIGVVLMVLMAGATVHAAAAWDTTAQAKAANAYIPRLIQRVEQWKTQLPAMAKSADRAAKGVIAGGHLYLGPPHNSFTWEALGRSGGLMLIKLYRPTTKLTANDTVLAAIGDWDKPAARAKLKALTEQVNAVGAQLVMFDSLGRYSPRNGKNVQVLPSGPWELLLPMRLGLPINSVSNVVGLWAWTGQFITACVNRGKMPCVYRSYGMPGGKERGKYLAKHDDGRFHAVTDVTPKAAAHLAADYLAATEQALKNVWSHDDFAKAASLLRKVHEQGGTVQVYYVGHMFPMEIAVPESPKWVHPVGSIAKPVEPGKNDGVLVLGYQKFPWQLAMDALTQGHPCIVTTSWPAPAEFTHQANAVYLDPYWGVDDAAVTLPGYDARVLTISGVIQSAIYWQLVEEAMGPRK